MEGGRRRTAILREEAGISSMWVQETSETHKMIDTVDECCSQTRLQADHCFLLRTLVKQEMNTLMEEISLAKENGGWRHSQLAGRAPYLRMIWSCVNFTKDSYCSGKRRTWDCLLWVQTSGEAEDWDYIHTKSENVSTEQSQLIFITRQPAAVLKMLRWSNRYSTIGISDKININTA